MMRTGTDAPTEQYCCPKTRFEDNPAVVLIFTTGATVVVVAVVVVVFGPAVLGADETLVVTVVT